MAAVTPAVATKVAAVAATSAIPMPTAATGLDAGGTLWTIANPPSAVTVAAAVAATTPIPPATALAIWWSRSPPYAAPAAAPTTEPRGISASVTPNRIVVAVWSPPTAMAATGTVRYAAAETATAPPTAPSDAPIPQTSAPSYFRGASGAASACVTTCGGCNGAASSGSNALPARKRR